ncbi:protein kinase family protein [Paenibacillus sp. GSMTC-2017]|uniref:serine/threonine protein kinase n=1 Tax=Paenibacillus sp. GSMTC-2017 TaxID=2794350 RepID=UPI0018D7EE09|nr:protein kinase family protein [Paenibacillus sp. GSMTC-2017]MBH5318677.1 protein kinase family protein [Paenibacillus sp. GSMTC-2017]
MWRKFMHKCAQVIENWRDYPLEQGAIWAKRYRIDHMLGMGSYGQAYTCTDIITNKVVLLKRNKPSKGNLGIELLRRESSIMQSLSHPQIPKWLNYSKRWQDEALIMEYVEGYNLEFSIYELEQSYSERDALLMIQALLKPLVYLHNEGFVHRDVRIPNVLIREGTFYLIDFGLSCGVGEQLSEKLRHALGEQSGPPSDSAGVIKKKMRSPNPASDWFGLGHLFLFVMYAGYDHPEGEEEKSWEEELQLHPEVRSFVSKLLNDGSAWSHTKQCENELEELLTKLKVE